MNSNVINSKEKISWEIGYNQLLTFQKERNIHPVHETNPDVMKKIVEDFLSAFSQIPTEAKMLMEKIATMPLFPNEIEFEENSIESIETTRPLNYIMFTANKKALDILSPYLRAEDWLRPGPYGSTFVHCVISGIENNFSSSGDPAACVEELVKRYPHLKTKENFLNSTPLDYLKVVLPKLEKNCNNIYNTGGGGFGGLNKTVSVFDRRGGSYNETTGQYEKLIEEIKKIQHILDSK